VQELTSTSSSTSSSSSSSTQGEKRRISIHQVDLASKEEIAGLFEDIKKEHKGENVDILISNAGYGKRIVDISYVSFSYFCVSTIKIF
jgi:3-oxoacyl-[acyl-carrier protein] reductase